MQACIRYAAGAVLNYTPTTKMMCMRRMSGEKITVYVHVPHENLKMAFQADLDSNLKTIADGNEDLKRYLECACSGNAICSTCHVYVDPLYMDRVAAAEEAEVDILDLVASYENNSRLGCQISFTRDYDGITFSIPEDVNNLL